MTAAREPCDHCQLPIPPDQRVEDEVGGRALAFCCQGCRGAYHIIHGAGLGDFYRTRRWRRGGTPEGVFDTEYGAEYLSAFVREGEDGTEISALVEGIRCASCVWLLEHLLGRVPGVERARLNFATHQVRVLYDPGAVAPAEILRTIARIGYLPRPYTADAAALAARDERRRLLFRFGTSAFLSMQLMGYSLALYAGYFQGMDAGSRELLQWMAAAVATPVVLYGGAPFFAGARRSLANRAPDMDLLIALGVGAAYGYSLYALAAGREVYFDSAAMIVTLVLAGRLFELGARRRASAGIDRLLRLVPDCANRVEGEALRQVPSSALENGDTVLVRPGERFPADGEVLEGETEADEAAATGEPTPVARGPGGAVTCGTLNLLAAVTVRVTAAGADSFIGRVADLVEQAQLRKAPVQRLADRVAAGFVPAVVAAALATWAAWSLAAPGTAAPWTNAVAVLVVACPCALGLATPIAVLVATGAAAQAGVLFRGGEVLEGLARVSTVAFDKTGTLTRGLPRVVGCRPAAAPEDELLRMAATAEWGSAHPLGRALREEAERRGLVVGTRASAATFPGKGVLVETPEGPLAAGSEAFLAERGVPPPEGRKASAATEVHVALGRRYLGCILLEDSPRPEAGETVARLHSLGLATVLLTGDGQRAAERVAAALGIAGVRAGLSPAEKEEFVGAAELRRERVLMVGDGINDAPALTAASVGCAVAGGTDIALETSDLVLTRAGIGAIPGAVGLARKTLRVIRQNLFWAFAYNLAALPAAAAGKLAPVHAAAAMALSSACVLANSLRLARAADRGQP